MQDNVTQESIIQNNRMAVHQAIESRRSVKYFDPHHKMTQAEIDQLMSLAMLSPTAFNIQHWRFVVVTDPVLRQQIRAVSWNQAQVEEASLLIVLTADLKAWAKQPERYWQHAPQAVADVLIPAISQYYEGNEQAQRDEAMRSCGMAAMTIMLAAKEMGYDTCPMDGFDFNAVAKLLNLPADHTPAMFVTVGKAMKKASPRSGQLIMNEVVIQNKF
jgi:nitroreductase